MIIITKDHDKIEILNFFMMINLEIQFVTWKKGAAYGSTFLTFNKN